MLTLTGTLRATAQLGGGSNRKTGELIPVRQVLQLEGLDSRGLVQLYTLTVPDITVYQGKVGQQITLPVRAWAQGVAVNLSYEGTA
jgi:hypothetical protein